jgi:hypothetical protein
MKVFGAVSKACFFKEKEIFIDFKWHVHDMHRLNKFHDLFEPFLVFAQESIEAEFGRKGIDWKMKARKEIRDTELYHGETKLSGMNHGEARHNIWNMQGGYE